MASGSGEVSVFSTAEVAEPEPVAAAAVWVPGNGPSRIELDADIPAGVVRWFDVSRSASVEGLLERLESHCPGLEPEMLQELLALDELPQSCGWDGGAIRLASTFGIYPAGGRDGADWARAGQSSPNAVYQAVELLSGGSWLITKWHDPCLYCGSVLVEPMSEAIGKERLLDAVAKRWIATRCQRAGDLGVLMMRELAMTYAPAYRSFRTALEEWEMRLYGFGDVGGRAAPDRSDAASADLDGSADPEIELRDLWGARARFRDWLSPLNVSGLQNDLEKAWLPAEDKEAVKDLDNRIDKALDGLRRLGDTLRGSFQLLHIQKSEAQREHRERLQRRIEVIATVFLVPTLVVGFFGANTWVPGEHEQSGLEGMVIAMIALTLLVMAILWVTQRWHDAKRVEWHSQRRR